MKIYLFLFLLSIASISWTQITDLGLPEILKNTISKTEIYKELPEIDTLHKNSTRDKLVEYGKPISLDVDVLQLAKKDTLKDGSVVYQYGFWCKKAVSVNVVFSKFKLKQGSTLYLVGATKNTYIGAYTSLNNSESNYLGTDLLYDEKVIIELKEPLKNRNTSMLTLETVVHGYQSIERILKRKLNDSGRCNIDVNCPQGNGYENQRNAVVLILNGSGGLCTGTMMNTTEGPIKPYMLTALHCGTKPQGWVYRFRWEAPTDQADCGTSKPSSDAPQDKVINGSTLVAKSSLSDFLLCELNAMPDPIWNVYFSGWNNSGKIPLSGTGIHHPYADIKKISIDKDSLHSDAFNPSEPENHWRTNWDYGITEVGSSGSPLFDENHLLIGQLRGGDSDCISDFMTDFYGKFSESWEGLGKDSSRLKTWLDPINAQFQKMDGAYQVESNQISDDAFIPFAGTNLIKTNCAQSIIPYVIISNGGTNILTKATISFQYDDESVQTVQWTGLLKTYERDTVFLPKRTFGQGEHIFNAAILTEKDLVSKNNSISHSFIQLNNGQSYSLILNLDNKGAETNWKITNKKEEILYTGGPYDNNTPGKRIIQDVCLAPDCYKITIYDYNGNGMNELQNGSMYLVQNNSDTVASISPNTSFKSSIYRSFCYTEGLSNEINLYPNPVVEDELTIQSTIENIQEILVFDLTGKQITNVSTSGTVYTMRIDELHRGIYLFQVKTSNQTYIKRVLIL
jgi:lysyl endopeptidase